MWSGISSAIHQPRREPRPGTVSTALCATRSTCSAFLDTTPLRVARGVPRLSGTAPPELHTHPPFCGDLRLITGGSCPHTGWREAGGLSCFVAVHLSTQTAGDPTTGHPRPTAHTDLGPPEHLAAARRTEPTPR